jgi:putative FmdB family regulatory protein
VPIYEYQCAKCGEVFEAFQKLSDDPLTRCKFCKGKVERLISQSSFQLKGSGWYLTDYARKSSSPASADADSKKSPAKSEKAEKPAAAPKADKSSGS